MRSERRLSKYRGNECLNCFQPLDKSEKYCHNCGQLNSTKKLSFSDFFNEFFAGILAYDSRFYRTVGSLLFNPGKISKDYVEGKRQRYANPYRFYLSASIIFFIIMGFTSDSDNIPVEDDPAVNAEVTTKVDSIRASSPGVPMDAPDPLASFENQTLSEVYIPYKELDTMGFWAANGNKIEIFWENYEETGITDAEEALDTLEYPATSYNKWLYKKTVDLKLMSSDSSLFFNYFTNKLPFIIFFYLPVFALFIWLLYVRRSFTYMEHLIFTFHNQTMWFLLFSTALIIDYFLGNSTAWWMAIVIFLVYLYKAMYRFYGQGRVKTFLKFVIVNVIFFILAMIATVFSLIASFAVY